MGLSIAMVTSWKVRCGIASYSENLANALAKRGVSVYIVRLPRFGQKSKEIVLDVADRIPTKKIDLIHVEHEYGLYQGFEPDFYGYLQTTKLPIVTTMHAVGSWQTDAGIATVSKKVIVHNKYCADRFGFPCVVIPHGCLPAKRLPKDDCKKSFGIDPRIKVVGYCGFISNYKGLEDLILAMTKVENVGLVLGGGWHVAGPETQYIAQLRQSSLQMLGDRCQWIGYVSDDKLASVYGSMDVVVYPSRYVSESGALLMALSHGKAVIARNLAPMREKAELGALTLFNSVDDLVQKIKELLEDDSLRKSLEEGAKKYCQANSWDNVAKRHIELYKSILTKPKKVRKK